MTKKIDQLISKYDRPIPRYTSYPSVPDWNLNSFNKEAWEEAISVAYNKFSGEGISLYIHLPYCESLCTYCGCNTRITVNHAVETPYIEAIIKEFQLIKRRMGAKPLLKEIHLGGGTPTFFSPENLAQMLNGIFDEAELADAPEFSFEGHPNNTTKEHLQTLYDLGFRRVSFGIQDSDVKVQKAINRIQPDEAVIQVTVWARAIGYTSVNFDLIYGLPFQTIQSIEKTMQLVDALKPHRIAYYSYAHVPWKRPGQRAYNEKDLPSPREKHELNTYGQSKLQAMGYLAFGMDHFALPADDLTLAFSKGTLHRNFMGYTTNPGQLLIGLGVSAISDIAIAYAQNPKTVEGYLEQVQQGVLPQMKGHMMTPQEIRVKQQILTVACEKQISEELMNTLPQDQLDILDEMVLDGILQVDNDVLKVTEVGTQFLRNVCALFDPHQRHDRVQKTFSRAV